MLRGDLLFEAYSVVQVIALNKGIATQHSTESCLDSYDRYRDGDMLALKRAPFNGQRPTFM